MSQGNAKRLSPKGVTARRSRSDQVTAQPADKPQPVGAGDLVSGGRAHRTHKAVGVIVRERRGPR
jgi:hypothetical protein